MTGFVTRLSKNRRIRYVVEERGGSEEGEDEEEERKVDEKKKGWGVVWCGGRGAHAGVVVISGRVGCGPWCGLVWSGVAWRARRYSTIRTMEHRVQSTEYGVPANWRLVGVSGE